MRLHSKARRVLVRVHNGREAANTLHSGSSFIFFHLVSVFFNMPILRLFSIFCLIWNKQYGRVNSLRCRVCFFFFLTSRLPESHSGCGSFNTPYTPHLRDHYLDGCRAGFRRLSRETKAQKSEPNRRRIWPVSRNNPKHSKSQ